MALRLAMEFVVSDMASVSLKSIAASIQGMGDAGEAAAKHLEMAGERFAQTMKAASVTRAMFDAFQPGLDAAKAMEQAFAQLSISVSDRPAAQLEELRKRATAAADEISKITPFSAAEVMGQFTQLTKAGFTEDEVLSKGGVGEAAAKLATAEGGDTDGAAAAIIAMKSKYNLKANQTVDAADLLYRYGGASQASAVSLAEGMAAAAGTQNVFTMDQEVGALATMDNMGVGGSAGGTALKAFATALPELSKKTGGKLSFYDKQGNAKDVETFLPELRAYFGGLSEQKRAQQANKLFGETAQPTLEMFLKTGEGSFEDVQAKAKEARSLDSSVDVLSQTATGQEDAIRGNFESLMAAAFQPALEPLKAVLGQVAEWQGSAATAMQEDPRIAQGVTATAGLALVGGAAATAARGLQTMKAGTAFLARLPEVMKGIPGFSASGPGSTSGLPESLAAQKVFVTNWPGGGMPGATPGATPPPAPQSRLGKVASTAGKGLAVAGAAVAGWEVGSAIQENYIEGTQAERMIQGALAGAMVYSPARFFSDTSTVNGQRSIMNDGTTALAEAIDSLVLQLRDGPKPAVTVQVTGVDATTAVTKAGGRL